MLIFYFIYSPFLTSEVSKRLWLIQYLVTQDYIRLDENWSVRQ